MKIYDISIPITPTMPVWPGDPPAEITPISAITQGDSVNISQLNMGVHCGTHIDAPKHFIDGGNTVEQIPLEKLIGTVLVLEIDPTVNVITDVILKQHPDINLLKQASKIIFRTRNSSLWHEYPNQFRSDYVGIDSSGVTYLSQLHLDLIGIDYLSIAPYEETIEPHRILLTHDIVLLEGLNLSSVPSGIFDLYCLPLKLANCEGSPARVLLIERGD